MQIYSISHLTRYSYSEPITASVMEVRMQPRSDGNQSCVEFNVKTSPSARIYSYRDHLHNHVHTFDIPGQHRRLAINANSIVEIRPAIEVPLSLPESAWDALSVDSIDRECFDMLQAGQFTTATALTQSFAQEVGLLRRDDPLTVLRDLNAAIYHAMDYDQSVTDVDSPIDIALTNRKGVCQDFAHIMVTLVRGLGIPCRYVSGYLFHRVEAHDRSARDATHAWVEAWLPNLGWIGFDPTNNLICGERHIRVCIGLDYADAAPTRGVFTGSAETSLDVEVAVTRLEALPEKTDDLFSFELPNYANQQQQQQQQ